MRALSREDALFLYMETPDQHQHVVATMILNPATAPGGVDVDTLIGAFESYVRSRPELSQKLVKTPLSITPPVLIADQSFVFNNHIHRIAVPAPGTLKQLAMIVEDIDSIPLSHRRPLWEAWFISGLENDRLALVLKSHHCLADGVNGTASMTQLFDTEADSTTKEHPIVHRTTPRPWEVTYQALRSQCRYQPRYRDVLGRTARCLQHRRKLFAESQTLSDLVPALFEEAPRLKFNGPITSNRTAAMGSFSLPAVKRIKEALGITVNDVVVAACTLALRQYLIATDDLPDRPLICCQPVSLALKGQSSKKPDQGNEVGVMSLRLPVHLEDTAELVRFVGNSTRAAKQVFDQSFENLMQNYIGVVPPTVANWMLKNILDRKIVERSPTTANLVISNVPGPPVPLFLAGAKMEAGYGMGPIISGQGPNITFTSYADQLHFSLLACREQMPDIWMLADGIEAAFAQLEAYALTVGKDTTAEVAPIEQSQPKPRARKSATPPVREIAAVS